MKNVFRSTRLSRASTIEKLKDKKLTVISIHEALASLDILVFPFYDDKGISIHEALASLDPIRRCFCWNERFRSTRLSRASTNPKTQSFINALFRSTRLSRASTLFGRLDLNGLVLFRSTRLSRASTRELDELRKLHTDFDPRGSREPRQRNPGRYCPEVYFDPRGSREPRHSTNQEPDKT